MNNIPTSILGDISAITITSPDLEASFAFYQRLGFKEVMRSDVPFPLIQVSDGALLIMLRKDPTPYLSLTYYVKDLAAVVKDMEQKGVTFSQKPKDKDMIKRYIFQSPDGLNIALVTFVPGMMAPAGCGMLTMPQQDMFDPEKYVNKAVGMYGELAHPVADLDKSLVFWASLGFTFVSRQSMPYPWAIISDGLSVVGLHQTTDFSYPALTFFATDMRSKIDKLKAKGLTNYKEKGAGNIVLVRPEQQHIILFRMGMEAEQPAKKTIQQNVLETERLLLKEINRENAKEAMASYADTELMEFFGVTSAEDLAAEKNKHTLGVSTYRMTFKTFVIVEKATGSCIGKCGFHNWYAMHSRSEMGYHLESDDVKRKGFMTEAVGALIKHGFTDMGLNRIEAFVGPDNIPSLKVVRNAGFTEEGRLRQHYNKDGEMQDSLVFGLLRSEYEAINGPLPKAN